MLIKTCSQSKCLGSRQNLVCLKKINLHSVITISKLETIHTMLSSKVSQSDPYTNLTSIWIVIILVDNGFTRVGHHLVILWLTTLLVMSLSKEPGLNTSIHPIESLLIKFHVLPFNRFVMYITPIYTLRVPEWKWLLIPCYLYKWKRFDLCWIQSG